MDKAMLQGSPSRDVFKRLHKSFGPGYYCLDLDLVLVEKYPIPGIVAIVDFKKTYDIVSFAEVIGYNALLNLAPVYIVKAENPEMGPFTVLRYLGGNWRPNPPSTSEEMVESNLSLDQLRSWEEGLRQEYRQSRG